MNQDQDMFLVEEDAAERILDIMYKMIQAYQAIMDERRWPSASSCKRTLEELEFEEAAKPPWPEALTE